MGQVSVTLPDGSRREYQAGITFEEVAKSIGPGLAKAALAVRADGALQDVTRALNQNSKVEFITSKNAEGLEVIRHSTAHVLAMAVQKIWPGTQVTIGPVIEDGFYYDFAFPQGVKISDADLPKIEAEMTAIVKADHKVSRSEVKRDEAIKTFRGIGEHFKVEIIEGIPAGETISIYKMGDWFDLCTGPHVPSTGKLGAFKLMSLAGAYWRGDEKNAMLTRIYGTAWADKKDLEAYLNRLEEAKKRDHRVIGKQLDLFSLHPEAPAMPFFHPKGQMLYNLLVGYMRRKNRKYGFQEVGTPQLMSVELWKKSGHYANYAENMYFSEIEKEVEAALKPMNCPGHCLIFGTKRHSYRELPIRLSDFGRVHRNERSGVIHGIMRVRAFSQDDAHSFCTQEQVPDEIRRVLSMIGETYKELGFESFRAELSTRPVNRVGSDEVWDLAEGILKSELTHAGLDFKINPGEGAFYGPKIECHLIDAIGRSWQCGTIQLDFSMPERFGLEYIGADDKPHTPVMVHKAVLGSLERFMGVFIEHHAGHFPLWCNPVQVKVIPVSADQLPYARGVYDQFLKADVRVEIDERNEKLGYKIREAQLEKVPYMVIVGDKEVQSGMVTARYRDGSNLDPMSPEAFIKRVIDECGDLWAVKG